MICAESSLTEPLRVLSFESFKRTCLAKYADANEFDHKVVFGCRKCKAGRLIAAGELTRLPDNVLLLDLNQPREVKKMPEAAPVAEKYPAGLRLYLPHTALASVTELRPYWRRPLMQAKKPGVCPNCRREIMGGTAGLCGACYMASRLKSGEELLVALYEAAERFQPEGLEEQAAEAGEKPEMAVSTQAAEQFLITPVEVKALTTEEVPDSGVTEAGGLGLRPIPPARLASLKPGDLREFFILPVMPWNTKGTCPACERPEISQGAYGLCSACARSIQGKAGRPLLEALTAKVQAIRATSRKRKAPVKKSLPPPAPAQELVHFPDVSIPAEFFTVDLTAPLAQEVRGLEIEGLGPAPGPVVPGYEALHRVLMAALDQAQAGKGKKRHANDRPFLRQPIMEDTRNCGLGAPAFQARKKILEAINCAANEPERAKADLLGAINYVAAVVLALEEGVRK